MDSGRGFQTPARQLEDVRSLKPEQDKLEGDVSPSWDGFEPLPSLPLNFPKPRVGRSGSKQRAERRGSKQPKQPASADFSLLLKKLMEAHVAEVEAARTSLEGRPGDSGLGALSPLGNLGNLGTSSQATTQMDPAYTSPAMVGPRSSGQSSAVVTAEKILRAWDSHDELESATGSGPFSIDYPKQTFQSDLTTSQSSPARGSLKQCLLSPTFEVLMSALVLLNLTWMAVWLQVEGQMVGSELRGEPPPSEAFAYWRAIFLSGDVGFAIMFVLEPLLRLLVLRSLVCRVWLNYIDMIAGVSCAIEVVWFFQKRSSGYQEALFLLRILRIGKLFRALKLLGLASSLSALQLLVKCLQASRGMLFWTFCLLSLLQAVAAIVLNIFAVQYCNDRSQSLATREEVFLYYGTFTRSFLTMFEVMFANWGPACRVVVEDISEWFAIFFLLYRCVFGFALLNVVNSVFVQQTMKTASSDEDLAFKQKEKDKALYNRKVKKLFQNIDVSGDGSINLEEFTKLVQSPKLKFWMSQLELEYHDLLSLFEFLDNGDGEITLAEFIEGAARLRGSAKALDIWRMETKLEVLFDYTLQLLEDVATFNAPTATQSEPPESPTGVKEERARSKKSVQDVLDNSSYKHLRTTTAMTATCSIADVTLSEEHTP